MQFIFQPWAEDDIQEVSMQSLKFANHIDLARKRTANSNERMWSRFMGKGRRGAIYVTLDPTWVLEINLRVRSNIGHSNSNRLKLLIALKSVNFQSSSQLVLKQRTPFLKVGFLIQYNSPMKSLFQMSLILLFVPFKAPPESQFLCSGMLASKSQDYAGIFQPSNRTHNHFAWYSWSFGQTIINSYCFNKKNKTEYSERSKCSRERIRSGSTMKDINS